MFKSKYSSLLTIILIVAIIAILGIMSVLGIKTYKKYKTDQDATDAIARFDNNLNIATTTTTSTEEPKTGEALENMDVTIPTQTTTASQGGSSGSRKVTYYDKYVMLGYIEIPSIRIKYPILEQESVASLEKSVAVRYPNNPQLNTVGNVVIVGHNYRNGIFFSNLKLVTVGDKIKITDGNGQTLVYTVYEKYETTPEDTAYITRNVGENIEITLVTCTDDSSKRIIVKAKV